MGNDHWSGGPPWRGGTGRPGWNGPPFGPGRRFRRGAFILLMAVALLVAALATILGSIVTGNAPAPGITVVVSIAVLAGLVFSIRWLWRNARTIGALMDAADRVAGGDLATRVPPPGARQLRRLTNSFNEMTEHLQTNEQRRRDLLSDIAHELRTPLQVIRGSVEGMIDGLYPADTDRLRPLLDETIVMARLLDDLRTLSMAEAGVLELHRETIDARAMVDDVVTTYRPMAEHAGIVLESPHGVEATLTIEADAVRVGEVLANLVTNALHHTPSGGRVSVGLQRGPDGGVTFTVRDTGRGIAPDLLPFVFDRFTSSGATDGTGLGLAIAKRLVEAHGGRIEATSTPDGGTTIRFSLP